MQEASDAPGVRRAGAAFASRREYLGISQRELAARKVISAPALIAFEKGRAWPRERTRASLEDVVQWPAGTLASLKDGAELPGEHAPARGPSAFDESGAVPLLVGAIDIAMSAVRTSIDNLPDQADPDFATGARAVLADLRNLESITARAVRTSSAAPEVIRALATVRRCYDDLMIAAANAPGATLGQRLYTARRRANLSPAEVAEMLEVPIERVLATEAEDPLTPPLAAVIEALIVNVTE